jgi:hypothetical protein
MAAAKVYFDAHIPGSVHTDYDWGGWRDHGMGRVARLRLQYPRVHRRRRRMTPVRNSQKLIQIAINRITGTDPSAAPPMNRRLALKADEFVTDLSIECLRICRTLDRKGLEQG